MEFGTYAKKKQNYINETGTIIGNGVTYKAKFIFNIVIATSENSFETQDEILDTYLNSEIHFQNWQDDVQFYEYFFCFMTRK